MFLAFVCYSIPNLPKQEQQLDYRHFKYLKSVNKVTDSLEEVHPHVRNSACFQDPRWYNEIFCFTGLYQEERCTIFIYSSYLIVTYITIFHLNSQGVLAVIRVIIAHFYLLLHSVLPLPWNVLYTAPQTGAHPSALNSLSPSRWTTPVIYALNFIAILVIFYCEFLNCISFFNLLMIGILSCSRLCSIFLSKIHVH